MTAKDIVDEIGSNADNKSDINYIVFYEWSIKIVQFAEMLLGVTVLMILILVPLVISLELIYINIPITRNVFDKIKGGSTRRARVAEFCLRDAVQAVEESAIGRYGGNSNIAYLAIKCKSLTVIGFVIAMLLQGSTTLAGASYGIIGRAIEYLIERLPG